MTDFLIAGVVLCFLTSPVLAEERRYDITGFDEVSVHAGVQAEIAVGPEFSVEAEALRGDLDRLVVERRGDRLVITRDQAWLLLSQGRMDRFVARVTLPEIVAVESTAGATVEVIGAGGALALTEASSGASLIIVDAGLADVAVQSSSGSTLRLSGTCDGIVADASSGSSIRAEDLKCETAELESSSGSSLHVYATETAQVDASSGASVRLAGGAEVTAQDVSSGASFSAD